jgi:phosphatidylglycerol:prolipoprotein diacylglycerol transferase
MGIVADFVDPVLFTFGSIKIYTYGFFMAMAFMLTHKLAEVEFNRLSIHVDTTHILVAAVIGGLVGAKLHYVLTWDMNGLFDINTGLSFQGGLFGGAAFVAGYVKYSGEQVARVVDSLACLIPLGHAIGKLGCFFSGDGCYGGPTSMPWGMSFPNGLVPIKKFVHPSPLYEFAIGFSLFVVFWLKRDDKTPRLPFDNFTRVLTAMCLSRVAVELWRDHPVLVPLGPLGGINQYQLLALAAAGVCLAVRTFVLRPVWARKESPPKSKKSSSKKKD